MSVGVGAGLGAGAGTGEGATLRGLALALGGGALIFIAGSALLAVPAITLTEGREMPPNAKLASNTSCTMVLGPSSIVPP